MWRLGLGGSEVIMSNMKDEKEYNSCLIVRLLLDSLSNTDWIVKIM